MGYMTLDHKSREFGLMVQGFCKRFCKTAKIRFWVWFGWGWPRAGGDLGKKLQSFGKLRYVGAVRHFYPFSLHPCACCGVCVATSSSSPLVRRVALSFAIGVVVVSTAAVAQIGNNFDLGAQPSSDNSNTYTPPTGTDDAVPGIPSPNGPRPGVLFKVTVAPSLYLPQPITAERQKLLEQPARIRRASGHGPILPTKEPSPALKVVMVGARPPLGRPTETVTVEGMRFWPAELLSLREPVRIKNNQSTAIAIRTKSRSEADEPLLTLDPGEEGTITPTEGEQTWYIQQYPYAQIQVKAFETAYIATIDEQLGTKPIFAEPAEYPVEFYHGTQQIHKDTLYLVDQRAFYLIADISEQKKVTIDQKSVDPIFLQNVANTPAEDNKAPKTPVKPPKGANKPPIQ